MTFLFLTSTFKIFVHIQLQEVVNAILNERGITVSVVSLGSTVLGLPFSVQSK